MSDFENRLPELQTAYDRLVSSERPDMNAIQSLEDRVRELYTDSAGSEINAQIRDLLRNVGRLRRLQTSGSEVGGPAEQVKAARVWITVGTAKEMRQAYHILAGVLTTNPDHAEAYDVLMQALDKAPNLANDIRNLLTDLNTPRSQTFLQQMDRDQRNADGRLAEIESPPPSPKVEFGRDIEALKSQMMNVYYAGDYPEALKLCMQILEVDPNNDEVQQYQARADDLVKRGVIPDTRLPLAARVAFNKGNSAARAGLYDRSACARIGTQPSPRRRRACRR